MGSTPIDRPWDETMMLRILLGALALSACEFDTSAPGAGAATDADLTMADAADDAIPPALCPDPIHLVLSVNGTQVEPAPQNQLTTTKVLLGDTVAFSAVGTCTQAGPIEYAWSFQGPSNLADTAVAGLAGQRISVYPVMAGPFEVSLTVRDGTGGNTRVVTTSAFRAYGFEDLDNLPMGSDVRNLHAGIDKLWIATKVNAFVASLDDPTAAPNGGVYNSIGLAYSVMEPGPAVNAVFESADGQRIWFGVDSNDGLRRLDLAASALSLETIALENAGKVEDIDGTGPEMWIATSNGTEVAKSSSGFNSFVSEDGDSVRAISVGATGPFAGEKELINLNPLATLDLFSNGDNKIRGLADDGSELWIASDGFGVARRLGGTTVNRYPMDDPGLTDSRVRSIVADSQGDIWAATQGGIHRFKKDRQKWVLLPTSNLVGVDLKAVAVDDANATIQGTGRRAIYIGSNDALAVMRVLP